MSVKNTLFVAISTNQSMATSFISPVTTITYMDNVTYEIICTSGGSVGTFNVQVSNDYAKDNTTGTVTNPGTWTTLTLSTNLVSTGSGDQMVATLNQLGFNAIRLQYVSSTAGTSTCTITIGAKRLG